MKRGYLPLYRKIQDHQFYKEKRVFSKYEAWIDILMEVRQKIEPKEVLFGMTIIICNHGQSLYSLRTWGKRWGWSGKKVSRYFILLEKLKQISVENVTVTTRITVLNYKIYDVKCHTDVTQATHEGNSTDTRATHDCPTNNNVKKENNEKNDKELDTAIKNIIESEFDSFWTTYDKKKDKIKCLKKWKLLKASEKELIFNCVLQYTQSTPDPQFRKNPLTWLNGKCWNDEIIYNLNPAEKRLKQNIEVSKEWLDGQQR